MYLMANRYKDALLISQGAVNPSGIAIALFAACRELQSEGAGTARICADPAIRLIVNQLSFLVRNGEMPARDWVECVDLCKQAPEPVSRGATIIHLPYLPGFEPPLPGSGDN